MAKIALIADALNPISLAFGLSLQQQTQDVLFLTGESSDFSEVPRFPIMTPFKKWSMWEGLRTVPQIMAWNPDVWHFLFTQDQSQSRPAHWVLASFASALPNRTLAASFFSNNQIKTLTDTAFLNFFDLRTFGSRSHMMRVKRRSYFSPRGLTEVLPPLEHLDSEQELRIRPEIERLAKCLSPFVLMPDPPPASIHPAIFKAHGMEVLLLSDRFKPRSEFFYTGPLHTSEREYLMRASRALVLAGCDLSVLELRRFHELAERTETPLVISTYQNELLPGLCWHQKSGWILEMAPAAGLQLLLQQNPKLELAKQFAGHSRHELTDSTLNELLRMYGRAFSARWS